MNRGIIILLGVYLIIGWRLTCWTIAEASGKGIFEQPYRWAGVCSAVIVGSMITLFWLPLLLGEKVIKWLKY